VTWLGGTAAALVGVAVGLVALALLTNRREGYQFRSGRVITLRKATRPDRVLVDVREHEGLADLDGGLAARFGARIRRLRRISPRPRRGEVQLAVSDPDAARQLAAQLQLPRPSRRRRALTVLQLDIARQLEIAPWEERARTAVKASQGPSPCPVVVYRCAGSPPARPSGPWERALYRGPAHLRPLRAFQPGVACLVGTPVSTAAGWRLRVPDSAGMLSKAPSRGTAAGEQLLALSELGLSGRQLVVLQAEPVDTPPRHLDALLPGFIGLSRDALDHGARAVLVMPPLPDHLAAASLDLIGREVGGRRPSGPPSSLVVLLTRLQELVRADAPAGTPTADRELNALLFLGT
jgi:hypothetical protein